MIKCVLFDFDLTVARTLRLKIGLLWHYARKFKVNIFWLLWNVPKFFGLTVKQGMALAKEKLNLDVKLNTKLVNDYHFQYKKRAKSIRINSPKLFAKLKSQNIKIGIISNEPHTLIKYVCDKHGLKFDSITDTIKGNTKADLIRKALRKFKVKPSETIYVGDHPNDIKAGKSAGVKTVAFRTILHSKRKLKAQNPDYMICSLNQIPSIIKN